MLRKPLQPITVPEPMLAEALPTRAKQPGRHGPGTSSWLARLALNATALDTASWQTRAARGISWHRSGKSPSRRVTH